MRRSKRSEARPARLARGAALVAARAASTLAMRRRAGVSAIKHANELDDKFRFAKGRPEPKDGKDGKSKDTPAPKDKPAAAEKSAPAPRERAAPAPKLAEPAPVVARNAFDALADSMNS